MDWCGCIREGSVVVLIQEPGRVGRCCGRVGVIEKLGENLFQMVRFCFFLTSFDPSVQSVPDTSVQCRVKRFLVFYYC